MDRMWSDTVYRRGGSSGFPEYPVPIDYPRPPDQRVLFPPRFGISAPPLGIMDVLNTVRLYPDNRSVAAGYGGPGYSGSSTPSNPMM